MPIIIKDATGIIEISDMTFTDDTIIEAPSTTTPYDTPLPKAFAGSYFTDKYNISLEEVEELLKEHRPELFV